MKAKVFYNNIVILSLIARKLTFEYDQMREYSKLEYSKLEYEIVTPKNPRVFKTHSQYVTYTWNISIEDIGIRPVYNHSWIFVKVYHSSVVILEYDGDPFVKRILIELVSIVRNCSFQFTLPDLAFDDERWPFVVEKL